MTENNDFFQKSRPVLRWMVHSLIFFAIPLLIISAGFGRAWDREEQRTIERAFARLDQQLLLMRKRGVTQAYLSDQFGALNHIFRTACKDFPTSARKAMNALHRRFPGILRMVVLDAQGRRIAPELDPSIGPAVSRRLFEVFRDGDGDERRSAAKKHRAVLRGFLGPTINPDERIDNRQAKLVDANPTGDWRWLVHSAGKWGVFFAHIRQTKAWDQLAYRDQTRLLRVLRPGRFTDLGITDSRTPGQAPSDVAAALREHHRSMQIHQVLPVSLVALQSLDSGAFLWATLPRTQLVDYDRARLWLTLAVSTIFACLALLSARVMLGSSTFVLAIRSRLLLLFAFAGGVPLILIAFVEWESLAELERTRIREACETMERRLHVLDGTFTDLRADIERKLDRLLNVDTLMKKNSRRDWRPVLDAVVRAVKPRELFLFDNRGQPQIKYQEYSKPEWQEKSIKEERSTKILGTLIHKMCSMLDHTDASAEGEMAVSLAEAVTGSELPIGDLATNLGKIFEFAIFKEQRRLYLLPVRSPDGKIERVFTVAWKRDLLERFFLQRAIPAFERRFPGFRVMAWAPSITTSPIPVDTPLYKPLRPFLAALEILGGTQFGEHFTRGGRLLVTGIKPRQMADHLLVAVRDDRFIQVERLKLIRTMIAFTSTLFGITLFLGLILSQRFLRPIGELTGGIEAISRRDFKHRLPTADNDELGRLSETFNQMMEGLSDLAVGRIIQENLFPQQELVIGPYHIFGRSHPATELCGDYFDIKQLPDDRALIIIGDVTGHGVGPAMVMAMAKIMVEYCLADFHLDTFTAAFNDALFRVMKRRRMMSCFLAILDTKRHVLQMVNAGHNFPYIVRKEAKLLEDMGNNYPLGSRARMTPIVLELPLNPGDSLLFYTDGLIETDAGTDLIGYDALAEVLPSMIKDDLPQSCTDIYAWNRRLAVKPQQEDDITILLVRHQMDI
ncbi:MAG: SpoIIE family protein phosphatase [Candidatus Ozemobacteraceae bacterium]